MANPASPSPGNAARRRLPPPGETIDTLETDDGARLRYAVWPADRAGAASDRGTVLVLPGRTEFIEKYYETVADLRDRGYAVAVLDWRNQGLSHRPLANRHKHHLTDFRRLAADLAAVVDRLGAMALPAPLSVLAHSMGSHCTLRYLRDCQDHGDHHDHRWGRIARAVLCAPMVGIHFGAVPVGVARALAWGGVGVGAGRRYVPGQGDYGAFFKGPQWRDHLTSDPDRFQDEHWHIARNPDLALGGITLHWLKAAFKSMDRLAAPGYAEAIATPVLVVQCGADVVVDNAAMTAFAARLAHGQMIRIDGARHEILKERDLFRAQFWKAFDRFMAVG